MPIADRIGLDSLVVKFLVSLVLGVAALMIPVVVWATFADYGLSWFLTLLTLLLGMAGLFSGIRHHAAIKRDISRLSMAFSDLARGDAVHRLALASFAAFVIMVVFYLYIVPINVDALYFYLPTALYFLKSGHIFPYADAPVVPVLYAWTYPTTFGTVAEPFREIPSLFIIAFPILVYVIASRLLSRRWSLISLVLASFSPFINTATWLWPWHTDFIAGGLSVIAISLLLNSFRYRELFAGLSLSMALLAKTPFGLAAAIIAFILILGRVEHKVIRVLVVLGLLAFMVAFGFLYSFSVLAFMQPEAAAVAEGAGLVALSTILFSKHSPIPGLNVKMILVAMTPVFLWIARQVRLGGSPFALPIFPTHFEDATWFSSFMSKVSSAVPTYNSGSILFAFLHPLVGLTILPLLVVGLYFACRNAARITLFLVMSLYYLLFLSAFSARPGFRQLYPMLFFIIPIAALGMSRIFDSLKINSSKFVASVTLLLVVFQSTQSIVVVRAYSLLGDSLIKTVLSIFSSRPTWLDYWNPSQLLPFIPIALVCLAIVVVSPLFLKLLVHRFRLSTAEGSFVNQFSTGLLLILVLSTMLLPILYDASASTGGNFSAYSTTASWYNYQIDIANDLSKAVKGGCVLTFSFDAFYYLARRGICYIDLLHGILTSYPYLGLQEYSYLRGAIEANNLSSIRDALDTHLHIRYVLLPTEFHYAYGVYEEFTKNSQLFNLLNSSNAMTLMSDYGTFRLYYLNFSAVITG